MRSKVSFEKVDFYTAHRKEPGYFENVERVPILLTLEEILTKFSHFRQQWSD